MAETQRIATYGRKPSCANNDRLMARQAERRQLILERNWRFNKLDDYIFHELSDDEEEIEATMKTSFNCVDYFRSREINTKEIRKFNRGFGTRHLLSREILQESPLVLKNMNKVFCSQWLSSKQIVFGTKCNKLMVYDVATKELVEIPQLNGRQSSLNASLHQQFGIYTIEINPSRTLLSTVGQYNTEIAIYKLPTMEPICVGERGHRDWIYDMCWVDDEYVVSGSKDAKMVLWRINSELLDTEGVLTHRLIEPTIIKGCKAAEVVRSLEFNAPYREIVAFSTNSYIHIWSAETFQQKLSRKLAQVRQENPCLSVSDNGLYAVGCQSQVLIIDARTLHPIKRVIMRNTVAGIKSTSFQNSILTIGSGMGAVTFFDLRAHKFVESSVNSSRSVWLKTSTGYVFPGETHAEGGPTRYAPAIYTHCYDASGTRLFCAGGPLSTQNNGCYAALWH